MTGDCILSILGGIGAPGAMCVAGFGLLVIADGSQRWRNDGVEVGLALEQPGGRRSGTWTFRCSWRVCLAAREPQPVKGVAVVVQPDPFERVVWVVILRRACHWRPRWLVECPVELATTQHSAAQRVRLRVERQVCLARSLVWPIARRMLTASVIGVSVV